jgi:Helicase HerA, central domain
MRLAGRLLWRYLVTGRPLWGPGDNASFLHDATVDYRAKPRERLTRARWRRLLRRHLALTVPTALAIWDVRAAGLYVLLGACALTAYAAKALVAWWPQRVVERDYVIPTWEVVAKLIGARHSRRHARRAVVLPVGWGTDDDVAEAPELSVRIHLPVLALDERTKERIARAAAQRLGIREYAAQWTILGTRTWVDLSLKTHAPSALDFRDVRKLWVDASPTRPLVGLGPKRVPVYADLDNDGPHIGVSGGTGTGKSTLMRIILAKRVAAGAGLMVLDYKVISHPWAARIAREDPNRVRYLVDEEPINDAVMAVFTEFQRRREILKEQGAEALEGFRPVDVLVEELNSLAERLSKWWGHERRRVLAEAKADGLDAPYLPTVCPSVDALAALVQMGRELGIRVHFAGQRLDASALSPRNGGAIRESITNRFLAKYTRQTWRMLCDGVPFEAFPGGPRGIWTAVVGGEVTHFRVPVLSNEEAYELAMGGEAPAGSILGAGAVLEAHERKAVSWTLGEAWKQIPGCPSLDALRQAVQRAKLEPLGRRGNALLYDPAELRGLYARAIERL